MFYDCRSRLLGSTVARFALGRKVAKCRLAQLDKYLVAERVCRAAVYCGRQSLQCSAAVEREIEQ
jgi:hypothetical protein